VNKTGEAVIKFAKAVTPPVLWGLARKLLKRSLPTSYQGVATQHNMRWLHEGRFAEIYDRHSRLNPYTIPNETRLRQYLDCMFAEFAKHVPGDFLSAGISYGVAPRVIYDFVDFARLGKTYHFIDPFLGINNPGETIAPYNTDFEFVRNQYAADAPVKFHLGLIPDCFPLAGLEALAFVHLNTSHVVAEAASLPYLYERLSPGGIILIDYYSFGFGQFAGYDPAIEQVGASVFSMITGQGVIRKPLD
jgi:O-methyltransferase